VGQHRLLQAVTGARVEVLDVDAAGGDHHPRIAGPGAVVSLPPVRHEPVVDLLGGRGGGDPPVRVERRYGGSGVAVAKLIEWVAFPWLVLAAVVGQLDGAEARRQPSEHPAGVDLRELTVVPDEDDFRAVRR
jgi:hypothetical protein